MTRQLEVLNRWSDRVSQPENYDQEEKIVVEGRIEPLQSIIKRMTLDDIKFAQKCAIYDNAAAPDIDSAMQNVDLFTGDNAENAQVVHDVVSSQTEDLPTAGVEADGNNQATTANVDKSEATQAQASEQVKDNGESTLPLE